MRDDHRKSPFSARERIISLGLSVGAGIAVMAIQKSLLWGFVTFLFGGIVINAFLLWRRGWRL